MIQRLLPSTVVPSDRINHHLLVIVLNCTRTDMLRQTSSSTLASRRMGDAFALAAMANLEDSSRP